MLQLGQKQTFSNLRRMSALPPKADIGCACRDVRFVPLVEVQAGALGDLAEEHGNENCHYALQPGR
jgi:hypothetical protein